MTLLGNSAIQMFRNITVTDTKEPIVTLIGGTGTIFVEGGTDFSDPGATAYDSLDGDVTRSVVASSVISLGGSLKNFNSLTCLYGMVFNMSLWYGV